MLNWVMQGYKNDQACATFVEIIATCALELWWKEKTRRLNHKDSRKPSTRLQEEENEHEKASPFSLDDWEEWIACQ